MAFPVINIWMSLTASQKMKGFLNKLGIWGVGEWHREHTPCREATVQNIGINGSHPVLNLRKINRKVKNLPEMWETQVQSLGREDPLEKETATHSSVLAWRTHFALLCFTSYYSNTDRQHAVGGRWTEYIFYFAVMLFLLSHHCALIKF